MHVSIELVVSISALLASAYAIFQKPRVVTVYNVSQDGHSECSVCCSVVAKYSIKSSGKIVCKNCEGI